MRTHVLALVAVLVSVFVFVSCFPQITADEAYDPELLTLSIHTQTTSSTTVSPMGAQTRALADWCTRLQLAVFQGDQRVKTLNQTTSDADFGTLTLQLAPGEYRLIILAHNGLGNATLTVPEKVTFKDNKVTETFLYYATITLDQSTELDAVLHRVVSAFRLIITEPIPSDVATLRFYYTGGSSTLDATTGLGCVQSKQTELRDITSDLVGLSQTRFTIYTFPHEDPDVLNINVQALDATGNTLYERQFDGYQIRPNYITQHTDPYFQQTQSGYSLAPTLYNDGAWAGTNNQ